MYTCIHVYIRTYNIRMCVYIYKCVHVCSLYLRMYIPHTVYVCVLGYLYVHMYYTETHTGCAYFCIRSCMCSNRLTCTLYHNNNMYNICMGGQTIKSSTSIPAHLKSNIELNLIKWNNAPCVYSGFSLICHRYIRQSF